MPSDTINTRGRLRSRRLLPWPLRIRITFRDVLIFTFGAIAAHYLSSLTAQEYVTENMLQQVPNFLPEIVPSDAPLLHGGSAFKRKVGEIRTDSGVIHRAGQSPPPVRRSLIQHLETIPETRVLSHAPGFTVFNNLYMYNGTLYIVSSEIGSTFPEARYIISTPLVSVNTEENKRAREPKHNIISIIGPEQARMLWGATGPSSSPIKQRILTIEGNSVILEKSYIEGAALIHLIRSWSQILNSASI